MRHAYMKNECFSLDMNLIFNGKQVKFFSPLYFQCLHIKIPFNLIVITFLCNRNVYIRFYFFFSFHLFWLLSVAAITRDCDIDCVCVCTTGTSISKEKFSMQQQDFSVFDLKKGRKNMYFTHIICRLSA